MRVVTFSQVAHAVTLKDLVGPVGASLAAYSRGSVRASPAMLFDLREGEVHVKAAVLDAARYWSVKVSASVPANATRGIPAAHSTVTLFDASSGQPTVLIHDEGGLLTALRTAAAGAVATRLLAPRTETLLVVGTGLQARLQPQGFALERPFQRLLVWGRDAAAAHRAATDLQYALPEVEVRVALDLRSGVEQAQSIITATTSDRPLLLGHWLRPGQHVTAVGADTQGKRELDNGALARADRLYVDSIAQNLQVGDIAGAISAGALGVQDIAGELGALLDEPDARADEEITVAKLVGVGVQDLAAALVVLESVESRGPARPNER